MSGFLVRAREVVGLPVLTLHGDAIAQVKDVIVDPESGRVGGFTLSGRGMLSGPLKDVLAWRAVHALGRDAVMVADRDALREGRDSAHGADMLGTRVLTREGEDVGRVVDVVLEVTPEDARLVGYEVELDRPGEKGTVLLPVAAPVVVSAEHVLLPAATLRFTAGDLVGLPQAARGLREEVTGHADQ